MAGFYITTSIPYVNAAPHIGHALEFAQADVIARYRKLVGYEVNLVTGADENSLKNVKAAEAAGISVEELCSRNALLFRELADRIGLSYTAFVRSSVSEAHRKGVGELWRRCAENGDIYKKRYKGLYCVGCEAFYTEGELVEGKCPEHKTKPDVVEEDNYFFRLSKYQESLERMISKDQFRIMPESRKNEILSFIRAGLEDFSVSRSAGRAHGWGIPVPGDPSQTIYVWFDALAVYITGVGFVGDEEHFMKTWPADVHVVGKGIIRFHSVYWPAMLLSAGIGIPKALFVHGYFTVNGEKMSKSIGNVVSPLNMMNKYGSDSLRYYFIRDSPNFEDSNFSEGALVNRHNKELLGDLGNLVNRVLTIAEKDGKSEFSGNAEMSKKLDMAEFRFRLDNGHLHEALELAMAFVRECNAYVNSKEPWKLKGPELDSVLYNLLESLRVISIIVYPFVPQSAEKIAGMLGSEIKSIEDCKFRGSFSGRITKGPHLFEKIG